MKSSYGTNTPKLVIEFDLPAQITQAQCYHYFVTHHQKYIDLNCDSNLQFQSILFFCIIHKCNFRGLQDMEFGFFNPVVNTDELVRPVKMYFSCDVTLGDGKNHFVMHGEKYANQNQRKKEKEMKSK